MDPAVIGLLITVVTIGVFALGIPVAFGLGFVAVTFLLLFEGIGMSKVIADTFMEGLMEFTIVSIPMFIVMGMAVASSPAGKDLYSALDRWLNRVPGGLVVSNLGACALFAALSGSSPATCAAIGKMDEEQLYYLMSRGITLKNAERLIISGFLSPVLKKLSTDELKEDFVLTVENKTL